jgi:hypothetical protein
MAKLVNRNKNTPAFWRLVRQNVRGFYGWLQQLGAGAAANRRVIEADVAAAAALAAGLEAVAASLDHRTAGLVARRAADAAAVFGVFALANTAGQIALAAANAVAGATAAAQTVGQHAAEILQCAAGNFIIAAAVDLAAVRCLFELDGAARQHAPIGAGRRTARQNAGLHARARERCDGG